MRKPCTNLAPKLSPNRLKRDSIWHTWSRSSIGCVQIDIWEYGTFNANHTPRSTIGNFHNRPNRAFTWASSPRSTIGNFHNDFWACTGHKPCNYLAPKLILSPTRPKRDSIWYTSSSSSIGCIYRSIGCVQIDFWAYGMFHANRAPILHQD